MAKIFITGALGFAGRKLAERLLADGHDLFGAYLLPGEIRNDPLERRIGLFQMDVRDETQIVRVLTELKPDILFHLAAIVPIHLSIKAPAATMEVNVVGTTHLLEAVRKSELDCRILLPGSSEEYGLIHPDEAPVTEDQPLRPTNPYGVSKAAQTLLGLQYFRMYGLKIICARPFNMTGPGQTPDYACPAFARQIAMIEKGLVPPVVRVGNLSPRRDYSDIRDIMRAFVLLAERGRPGEVYNMCSGQAIGVGDMLNRLLALARVKIDVQVDPALARPVENELVLGSNAKLAAATGYQPAYTFDQTLTDVLDYWRSQPLSV